MKRILSLFVAMLMLLPFATAFADDYTPSGSSRAGDTVTWTATGSGGVIGTSDITTYDNVEESGVGSNSSTNIAHKTGDSIEDSIGNALERLSDGKMKLSNIFWDGVNGRYINIEEAGFSPEQLLEIARIALEYQKQANSVLHLTADTQELIRQKKDDFTAKFERVNTSLFDPDAYNPGAGIGFNNGANPNLDMEKPTIKKHSGIFKDWLKTRQGFDKVLDNGTLHVITYAQYMKDEFGIDVSKQTEYKLDKVHYWPNNNSDSISTNTDFANELSRINTIKSWSTLYPVKAASVFGTQMFNHPQQPTIYNLSNDFDEIRFLKDGGPVQDFKEELGDEIFGSNFRIFGVRLGRDGRSVSNGSAYHLLKDPKHLYNAYTTVVVFRNSFTFGEDSLSEDTTYIIGVNGNDARIAQHTKLNNLINTYNTDKIFVKCAKEIKSVVNNTMSSPDFMAESIGKIMAVVIQETVARFEANKAWNDKMREETAAALAKAEEENASAVEDFLLSDGDYIPSQASEGTGYSMSQFKNVKNRLDIKKRWALAAILAKPEFEDLQGGAVDINSALVGSVNNNLANAQSNADANKFDFDAAKGDVIVEMADSINDSTGILDRNNWPKLGNGPDDDIYFSCVKTLQKTFGISDNDMPNFINSLLTTITECYEEAYPIEGVGPNGYIVDFETKEARYLALQAYLFLMCAKDTINVQHVVVCEGNSYVNNVILSQSPTQFPAEVTGLSGVANYCWAIQCVDSPYAGDIGRYVAKATNGNQLSYRFLSPGTYRIVATRNMLSTVESVVAMTYHEYWYLEDTGMVIYSRIVKGHVNTTGAAQFSPAGRNGDDVCLYFNRHGEMSCYSDGDDETGIPGTVVFETYWTVTDGAGFIPPAGVFGSDSYTRQTG